MDACHIGPISCDYLSPKNELSSAFAKLFQAALLIASLKAGKLSGVYLSIMSERKTRLTISAIRHMMRFAYHWKFGVSLSNALCLDWESLQENVEKDRMPWSVS